MAKKVADSKVEMTEVLSCRRVPTKLYEEIKRQMLIQINKVQPNKLYKLKDMCGEDFWDRMNSWQQRESGRAFAHMVHAGLFPFKFILYKKSPTKRYLLK